MRFCVEKNSERSKRERASEREKCLEAEKMKENENLETLKCLNYGKGWVEFGYIVFGLNGPHWVFI